MPHQDGLPASYGILVWGGSDVNGITIAGNEIYDIGEPYRGLIAYFQCNAMFSTCAVSVFSVPKNIPKCEGRIMSRLLIAVLSCF